MMKPLNLIAIMAFFALLTPSLASAFDLSDLAYKIKNPKFYLKEMGPLVVLGNSSIDAAQVVFLPEVHDDAKSLTYQLLMIAREKEKNQPFIVLDESLLSMKKSIWDIFSQKSLEIIAAQDQRKNQQKYAPRDFEKALQTLANKFKGQGQLHKEGAGLWTLAEFSANKTPFFGWDTGESASLTGRNVQMVKTLKTAIKDHNRILIMVGARHIPELEHMTSLKLLCQKDRFKEMSRFFSAVRDNFGDKPELKNGVGATLPIYDFLTNSAIDYAVVFSKDLYPELSTVVEQFKNNQNRCFKL